MPNDTTRASLELLYHVGRELSAALDLRTVLARVLSLSLETVSGERGTIIVLDDHGQPVEAAIVVGTRLIEHTAQQLKETVERGLAGWVIRQWKPALVPDTSKDSRWLRRPDDALERSGAKSAVCLPLLARERLVGVLTIVHPQPGFFNEEHLSLMQAIAGQAGAAVLNARLYDESQRQARVMTALAENAVALNASLRLDQVLQKILDQTAQALQGEMVALALIDEVTNELVFRAATAVPDGAASDDSHDPVAGPAAGTAAQAVIGQRRPLGLGIAGRVAQDGRGVVLPRVAPSAEPLPGVEVRSLVCAPIHVHGKIIGVLEAVNLPPASLDAEALLVLTGLGSLAGVAISNAQLYEQLEAAHRRYRELFEDSTDLIIITDSRGRVQEVNRQVVQTTGYDRAALLHLNIENLTELNRERTGQALELLAGGEPVSYEADLHTQSGANIPVEVFVHRIQVNDAHLLQWILRDISERKNLASLQDDLIGMVYHDLRSPLANVVSSLDLLKTMLPADRDPSLTSVLAIANRSTDRVQRLVSSLLDIRRLEAGQAITSQESISPETLVGDAVDAVRSLAESKHQSLDSQVEPNLPNLWVDADMMRRVLINLLENATKYTPMGGKITLGADRADGSVRMWVQDSGPGIPPSEHERIFDKFARLQTAGAPKGLGLGLAFCRLAVQAHGGRIWVESAPGTGSRFIVSLPAQPAA